MAASGTSAMAASGKATFSHKFILNKVRKSKRLY